VDAIFANDVECYHKAQQSLTFIITFTKTANKRCRRLSKRLGRQENATVAVEKCEGKSNRIQAYMFVESLFWVSKIHVQGTSMAYMCNYRFVTLGWLKETL